MRRVCRFLFAADMLAAPSARAGELSLDPALPFQGVKSDPVIYQVDLAAVVTPPYKCKVLKVWMPIPTTDAIQEVTGSKIFSFPMQIAARIGTEKVYRNKFAYFEFHNPQGAQIIRHQFTVKTHEVGWNIDPAKVPVVNDWPAPFAPYLRDERLIPVDDRFKKVALDIIPERTNPSGDLNKIMEWVNRTIQYSHLDCSLQGSAVQALEKKVGHCSDYHGLCVALGRSLGYPTRIVYGINPYPKNSPSHCKLEAFIPNHGWVCFDVSETQQMIARLKKDDKLNDVRKAALIDAAKRRLASGFRDNTWFSQTRGSDYDLEPPARQKVAVVRTIYAEADGETYPEPDPANPGIRPLTWMTVHHYVADREVTNPYQDIRSLTPKR